MSYLGTTFSGVILEKGEVDDEWEGTMLDMELLEQLQQVENDFWRMVWLDVAVNGKVSFSSTSITLTSSETSRNAYKLQPFVSMNTNEANKKGFGWSGDSYLSLYHFDAKDFSSACVFAITALFHNQGEFWMPLSASPPEENETNQSLDILWARLFYGEFDKFPKGKYLRWVYLQQTGNDFTAVIEYAEGSFYLYQYLTS